MDNKKVERPFKTPKCCDQDAKWVVVSINLAYFYCEKCKNEVTETSGVGGNNKWWGLDLTDRAFDIIKNDFAQSIYSKGGLPSGNQIPLPPPPDFCTPPEINYQDDEPLFGDDGISLDFISRTYGIGSNLSNNPNKKDLK